MDFITTDKFLQLDVGADVAYIKMDVLFSGQGMHWRGKSHTYRKASLWITGHSDYGVTEDIYEKYKSQTRCWFTFNKETTADNLFALPLGLTNDCDDSPIHRIYGNTEIMQDVLATVEPTKSRLLYMNFSIHTYPTERTLVWNQFRDQPWVTTAESHNNSLEARRHFLSEIRQHKFVLCPRGNGVDTHRLWETLYMESFPIVQRHVALQEFDDLPILWIDSWEEVTEDRLQAEYTRMTSQTWNLDKLQFSYWKAKIDDELLKIATPVHHG